MSELKTCRICLQLDAKMYWLDRSDLLMDLKVSVYYEEVMDLKVFKNDRLPRYFCYECAILLHKFHKFKEKCYRGLNILRKLLCQGPITLEGINRVDRKKFNLISTRNILTVSKRVKTYHITANLFMNSNDYADEFDDDSVDDKTKGKLKINNEDAFSDPDGDNTVNKVTDNIHNDDKPLGNDSEKIPDQNKLESIGEVEIAGSPTTMYNYEKTQILRSKSEQMKESKNTVGAKPTKQNALKIKNIVNATKINTNLKVKKVVETTKKSKNAATVKPKKDLDANHWKKSTLSEEEALKQFRDRAEHPRFATWPFKCLDCFKGFSKEKLFKDHRRLKHDKSLLHECRFCHMRYKWNAKMKEHMRLHFNKFQCLRCDYVCPLEHTAALHDDVHNGVINKCEFCNAEFSHLMSYYSHRRSHKSQYACSHCGVSFMSRRGLNMHKRVKHIDDEIESPEDGKGKTFCAKCDIRFETRKAYDQHLFHSTMHLQGMEEDSSTLQKGKNLEKEQVTEITKEASKSKPSQLDLLGSFKFPGVGKRRRSFKKPMNCYQCGKHFETQQQCRKHHQAEHPRTSFFAPSERHICEICGTSLAPDSVAHHLNTHTREKVYPCSTCGRNFHASVNLKRHMLTHTGEKPYSCSICDKKFTQPTNMKLHYKIYHIKEPIPKRIRRKKEKSETAATTMQKGLVAKSEESDLKAASQAR